MAPPRLGPVTIGASRLETDELAEAMLRSPFGQIDTSNNYAQGRSEAALGRARRGSDPAVIFSKADADPVTGAFDGDRVLRSFEETVTRLGVARLPVYHLHDPYTVTLREAAGPGGAIGALVALREQGLVDAIGIAAGPLDLLEAYLDTGAFDAVLTHNRYTLVDRGAAPLIAAARQRGIAVFNAAPFGGGLLAGSPRAAGRYAYRPAAPELLAYVDRLDALCREWAVPLPAAAVHFSLRAPDVDSTVVGISSTAQLTALQALVDHPVPDGFFAAVAELGDPP
ncbi:aldo/keto reductase [Dactylosporangium sp. AC04546]|uniref:aldo/keto reductase n=1 Tax=Dactylosporangium sp. AC04546 TaxID=2862460 RepID=UPI001EDDB8FC|nr:aldo/keto reductase [Dactylosporangium sp. AC04546]WVK87190.1 aldo/keto reductase [Dactylosporangium sp. AC04546]